MFPSVCYIWFSPQKSKRNNLRIHPSGYPLAFRGVFFSPCGPFDVTMVGDMSGVEMRCFLSGCWLQNQATNEGWNRWMVVRPFVRAWEGLWVSIKLAWRVKTPYLTYLKMPIWISIVCAVIQLAGIFLETASILLRCWASPTVIGCNLRRKLQIADVVLEGFPYCSLHL